MWVKRFIAAAGSAAILAFIFSRIDRAALWANLRDTEPWAFAAAMALFIPQNFIMILRWKMLAGVFGPMSWRESTGLILSSQTLNVVLPSKMGDLVKAYFVHRKGLMRPRTAVSLVVFEKTLDMAAMCSLALCGAVAALSFGIQGADPVRFRPFALLSAALCASIVTIAGLLYFAPVHRFALLDGAVARLSRIPKLGKAAGLIEGAREVIELLQARGARRGRVIALSLSLWGLHLLQIYCFFLALRAPVPPAAFAALMPLAIFAGLLPISLFGMGTRDAALIFLFKPYQPPSVMAAAGIYFSLRYIIPALAGIPFTHKYMAETKAIRTEMGGK